MGYWGKVLIGVAITVGLLYWALSGVAFSEVMESARQANPWLLLAASFLATAGGVIRAMRWKILLSSVKSDTSFRSRWTAVSIHLMANNILPLRVGEFARAWVLGRIESVNPVAAFGSLIVERFMDAVILLCFLVIPVFSPGFPNSNALFEGWGGLVLRAGGAAVVVILIALVLMVAFPKRFIALARVVLPILPGKFGDPLLHSIESFLQSLSILRDPKLTALGFLWTFGFWIWQATAFWLGMMAFGINTGFVSALFTSSFVAFGVALPSAPGFLGTFQVAAIFALSDVYGAGAAPALAFAFGFFFVNWLPITGIGLWYVWKLGLSLREVGSSEAQIG